MQKQLPAIHYFEFQNCTISYLKLRSRKGVADGMRMMCATTFYLEEEKDNADDIF